MIDIGSKVLVKNTDSEPITGTVVQIYDVSDSQVVIVKDEKDDQVYKTTIDKIELITEEPTEEPDAIYITRERFTEAVLKVCNSYLRTKDFEPSKAIIINLSGLIVCKDLEKELFEGNND